VGAGHRASLRRDRRRRRYPRAIDATPRRAAPADADETAAGLRDRLRLHADCDRCVALCCVAPAFARSADFALDKPAGRPCPNLAPDDRCTIHAGLRARGFPGCVAYDCFGAGQRLAQETFGGRDWRREPDIAETMFASLPVLRQLHELLWYLAEALVLDAAAGLREALRRALAEVESAAAGDAAAMLTLDVAALRERVDVLLREASRRARAGLDGPERTRADLVGADLRGADLRGAGLRGALLIGADLRRADLRRADLIGADLRGADLAGADLATALFVTRSQVDGARGDGATRLPHGLRAPAHWRRG
jgi:uncharacterized protein YjbI with pentapeptide repeats